MAAAAHGAAVGAVEPSSMPKPAALSAPQALHMAMTMLTCHGSDRPARATERPTAKLSVEDEMARRMATSHGDEATIANARASSGAVFAWCDSLCRCFSLPLIHARDVRQKWKRVDTTREGLHTTCLIGRICRNLVGQAVYKTLKTIPPPKIPVLFGVRSL
jgi:hypothetical protein